MSYDSILDWLDRFNLLYIIDPEPLKSSMGMVGPL